MHGGYFSNSVVAAPLVQKVRDLAGESKADVIIDLGGGVGSVLSELVADGIRPDVSFVNLDDSTKQLEAASKAGLSCVRGSVDSFARPDVGPEDAHFLYMMRSALHYFGKAGLRPLLRHLHAQTKAGEFFVHQTASFVHQRDADCLNELYTMMGTEKWYPTVESLRESLTGEGWQVLEVLPGPSLPLTNEELMQRYDLDQKDIVRIGDQLPRQFSVSEDVFKKTQEGFCAFLHYWIYVCTPARR